MNRTTSESSAKNRSAAALTTTTPSTEIIMAYATLNASPPCTSGLPLTILQEQPDEWRPVPGWPEYDVSQRGQVRRVKPAFGATVGRVLKPLLNRRTGYLSVMLCHGARPVRIDIHRLVALGFHGPQPSPAHLVAHNDGVRTNNQIDNLRWATQRENLSDCRKHGTALVGSANPAAKLDAIDRVAIHRMKAVGVPRPVIAAGFGVHKRSIFKILATAGVEDAR